MVDKTLCSNCFRTLTPLEAQVGYCPGCNCELRPTSTDVSEVSNHLPEPVAAPIATSDVPSSQVPFSDIPVICPSCHTATEDLKVTQLLSLWFLFVYVVWTYDVVVGCPTCVRKSVWKRIGLSLFTSNLLFPIAALSCLGSYFETHVKGHADPYIAEKHRLGREERIAAMATSARENQVRRRELIVLGIIAALALSACFIGFLFK
jgi:hypothetical protein